MQMWTQAVRNTFNWTTSSLVTLSSLIVSDSRYRTRFRLSISRWLKATYSEIMIRKIPYRILQSICSYCLTIRLCISHNCPCQTLSKLKREQVDSIGTKYTVEHNTFNVIQKVLHVSVHQNHHRALLLRQFTNTSTFAKRNFFGSDNSLTYDYLLTF